MIRPAAYCGVVGFKPTRGTYSTAGVKPLSPYLDTVGLFARAVADIVLFDGALRESAPPATALRRPRCGFFIPYRDQLDAGGAAAMARARRAVEAAGGEVVDMPHNPAFEALVDLHQPVMLGDAGRNLAVEARDHGDKLIPYYLEKIAEGQAIDDAQHAANQAEADRLRMEMAAMAHGVDVIITPPAPGEAPESLVSTGDPLLMPIGRYWAGLASPCRRASAQRVYRSARNWSVVMVATPMSWPWPPGLSRSWRARPTTERNKRCGYNYKPGKILTPT